jgi:alpha-1,2-mannosyltransferase
MSLSRRPAPSPAWWLATESYELFGFALLALAAFGARRLTTKKGTSAAEAVKVPSTEPQVS